MTNKIIVNINKLIILFISLFLLISCDLNKKSIFNQIGDFEKIDYNDDSPIRRGSVAGIAVASNGDLFIVSSLKLWKKNSSGQWSNLTSSLPDSFMFASDIVQYNGKTYILATSSNTSVLGLIDLNTSTSAMSVIGTKDSQQPIQFFKEIGTDGKVANAYIYAMDTSSNKYVYDISLSEITPKDASGARPNSLAKVVGMLSGTSFVIKTYNQVGEQEGQIWQTSGGNIIKISPNYEIFVVGKSNIEGSQKLGVGIRSGAFLSIDASSGKINDAEDSYVKGFSSSVVPSFLSYIDGVSVVGTDRYGYFENLEGKKLAFPTSETTDVASYSANKLSTTNVQGIFTLDDGKTYIATSGSGAWVRDNATKKWSGV